MSEASHQDYTKLMLLFGRIPEPFWKSLQSYPFIFFNEVETVSLDYDVNVILKDEKTFFMFDLALNLEKNDHLDKRYKGLEEAVRKLFWKEAKVLIKINGKEAYKSE
jgi:hypothetical protein